MIKVLSHTTTRLGYFKYGVIEQELHIEKNSQIFLTEIEMIMKSTSDIPAEMFYRDGVLTIKTHTCLGKF